MTPAEQWTLGVIVVILVIVCRPFRRIVLRIGIYLFAALAGAITGLYSGDDEESFKG